ncbi:MAG: hypothetical protein B7Z55_03170 [Planctomycetales bacterium 12-60-4]|nr:MAG: hypothetical protein B7Z55_03170 [Planctomycetales bacterium 12-60-4]
MMRVLSAVVEVLNQGANALGSSLLAPIAWTPGWLSGTVIACVSGVLMLLCFKYASRQEALRETRRQMHASLLAVSLFRDNVVVCLREQGRMIWQAARAFGLSLAPVAVMTLPMVLLLSQLAAWYQWRPLRVGEAAVLTVFLNGTAGDEMPNVEIKPLEAVTIDVGPVRAVEPRMICWSLRTQSPGMHTLQIRAGDQVCEKQLAVGVGYLRVSPIRSSPGLVDQLLYPVERPLPTTGAVREIELSYPDRAAPVLGMGAWLVFWFCLSSVAALVLSPVLRVSL